MLRHMNRYEKVPLRVRELGPADRGLVEAGFRRLLPASVRARFLGLVKMSPRLFTWVDELDGRERIAVGATHALSGAPLGLARCARDARGPPRSDGGAALPAPSHGPTRADAAAPVLDRWQGRGVGTALMAELARRAAAEGVTPFDATVFADNRAARHLAASVGDAKTVSTGRGVTSLEVRIA